MKMLNWANRFSISVFLDNNEYDNHRYSFYECLVAVEPSSVFSSGEDAAEVLDKLHEWHVQHQDWLFGHIAYDYKNSLFKTSASSKQNRFRFPDLLFYCPQTVCRISADKQTLTIETVHASPQAIFEEIQKQPLASEYHLPQINFRKRLDKEAYLQTITKLKEHIRNGDCYEINFCNEAYATDVVLNPLAVFHQLNQSAPAPFAAFYKYNNQYLLCSSPERYLCKQGDRLISQPIKGTIKRGKDEAEDHQLKQALSASKKDRAENIMIVDLVRNDLSISAEKGSIEVEELGGIYSYPRVHQMISTVGGKLKKNLPFTDVLKHSFPMGSMTGAPKVKVMELIEHYEPTLRELFSGSIGYITPASDFDFNVIIRSLFYNAATHYLSYQTGGAITYDSLPEQEWEETELKAMNMENLFRS